MTRICSYEGSKYRTEFWESGGREYENLAERIAMKAMLPLHGKRLVEVGAGFGRMVDMYEGYEQVVLLDYARTQLEEAQRYLGHDDRFVFVVADVYNMPFVDDLFDTLVMIRVMHHLANVPEALGELHRIVRLGGCTIVEHASKRHLKAILRWLLRRQAWSPFDESPHEFVALNIDYHPAWMRKQFAAAGLSVRDIRTLSHYRLPLLKKLFSPEFLAKLDGLAQPTGRWWQLTPSVFLKASPEKISGSEAAEGYFKCPACGSQRLEQTERGFACENCRREWGLEGGIYDFKTPLGAP